MVIVIQKDYAEYKAYMVVIRDLKRSIDKHGDGSKHLKLTHTWLLNDTAFDEKILTQQTYYENDVQDGTTPKTEEAENTKFC